MMMMSDLPEDLVEEILTRVPATSLKRLRSTCKRWNVLFEKRRFTKKHFGKAAKQSLVLMLKEHRLYTVKVNLNVSSPSIEFKGALDLRDSDHEKVDISEVFHCDGLLLCTTKDNRLVVWNLCLGETRWIQRQNGYERLSRYALGYVNNDNNNNRSYKILMSWSYYDKKLDYVVLGFEIYELSSDSWKVIDEVDYKSWFPTEDGRSLNGNTYWRKKDHLVCFDYTAERFKRIYLPPFMNRSMALSVFGEEQLSLLHRIPDKSKMEIFVTNKVGEKADLLWSKSFTVDLPIGGKALWSLLIDEKKKVILYCCSDLDAKTSENIVLYAIGEDNEYLSQTPYMESTNESWWVDEKMPEESTNRSWCCPTIFYYVPSLVQI